MSPRLVQGVEHVDRGDVHQARAGAAATAYTTQLAVIIRQVFALAEKSVALALRAYRVENGAYPTKLADLAPKYLAKLPDDPFAKSGPLGYKLTGDKYILYSIGPDGKDSGGTPINWLNDNGTRPDTAKGDVTLTP